MSIVDTFRETNLFRYIGFTERERKTVACVAEKLAEELMEGDYSSSIEELLDVLNDRLGRGASTAMKAETLSQIVVEIGDVIGALQMLTVLVEIAQWEVERTKK